MSRQVKEGNAELTGVVLDGFEFAREGRRLVGNVPIASLSRMADVLAVRRGAIECEVLGEQDQEGNAFLVLHLAGDISLQCQRCLETIIVPLRVVSRLLLMAPRQTWPDEELAEDGFDAIEAGKEMALLPMIEEEVLLALPLAPMHESCEPPVAATDVHAPSPFAALAKFKKGV
jgi:uncharacterized protein